MRTGATSSHHRADLRDSKCQVCKIMDCESQAHCKGLCSKKKKPTKTHQEQRQHFVLRLADTKVAEAAGPEVPPQTTAGATTAESLTREAIDKIAGSDVAVDPAGPVAQAIGALAAAKAA